MDGTKIEANANRCTFVWKKSTDRLQARLQTQSRELLAEIEEVNQREQLEYGELNLAELGREQPITSEQQRMNSPKKISSQGNTQDPQGLPASMRKIRNAASYVSRRR
ncbi:MULTISPECIES: hypothetical protein [Alicyclobacillus]|uniref:hypothetical protein n=1 Tax=Alicyclobacillus TaxID=29330 RepID=UPI0009DC103E|nr:hypothetical protein [Alicyclobacillus acidoterrestris]